MAKCWRVVGYGATGFNQAGQYVQDNGVRYEGWRRANSITTTVDTIRSTDPNPYYTGCLAPFLVIDGVQTREWSAGWDISEDPNNPNCPAEPKYDCINGECKLTTAYNTPGIYQSLEDCQSHCGTSQSSCPAPFKCLDPENYCPPGKVCIPQSEWNQIESLSGQLRNINCS